MFYFCTHLPSIDIYAQTSTLYHPQDWQKIEASLRWKAVLSNLQQEQSIKSCTFCVHSPALSGAWRFFLTVTVFLVSFPQAHELLTTTLLTTAHSISDPFQTRTKSFTTWSNLTWNRQLKTRSRKYFFLHFLFLLLFGLHLFSIPTSVCYQCSIIYFLHFTWY